MKLEELSPREFIALEVLPGILSRPSINNSKDAVEKAFNTADAFLQRTGRYRDEIAEANARAEKAELAADILRNMNEDGQFAARVALEQIWETLGVPDQTAAMQAIRDLQEGVKICLDAERARLADLKPGAPASQYTAARIEKLERLVQ